MTDMLGVSEIAERFGVSKTSARRWCAQGRFLHARRIGHTWIVPASDLEGFEPPKPGPEPTEDAMNEAAREARMRRMASKYGLMLRKSRARTQSINNQGGYMLVNADRNIIVWGERFELTLDAVEAYLTAKEK